MNQADVLGLAKHGLLLVSLLIPIEFYFASLGEGNTRCLSPRYLDSNAISEGIGGASIGTPNLHVSNLLYADGLCITSNSPNNLQTMLQHLKA
eukprot:1154419-Pelagomonas_calceolata.AAC.1